MVEHRGFEPLTSTLPVWRAPNCANAPLLYFVKYILLYLGRKSNKNLQAQIVYCRKGSNVLNF